MTRQDPYFGRHNCEQIRVDGKLIGEVFWFDEPKDDKAPKPKQRRRNDKHVNTIRGNRPGNDDRNLHH